jgi:hypothetical protein
MTSVDIAYGNNDIVNTQFDVPTTLLMELKVKNLEVIRGFVFGTDSNSWLKEAEENVNG